MIFKENVWFQVVYIGICITIFMFSLVYSDDFASKVYFDSMSKIAFVEKYQKANGLFHVYSVSIFISTAMPLILFPAMFFLKYDKDRSKKIMPFTMSQRIIFTLGMMVIFAFGIYLYAPTRDVGFSSVIDGLVLESRIFLMIFSESLFCVLSGFAIYLSIEVRALIGGNHG